MSEHGNNNVPTSRDTPLVKPLTERDTFSELRQALADEDHPRAKLSTDLEGVACVSPRPL